MFELKNFRAQLGVTQAALAEAMGMPIRSYEDLEAGKSATRPIHVCAAKWAAVKLKATRKDLPPLPTDLSAMMRHALEQDVIDAALSKERR